MFGSSILEVAIGVIFVYLLLSLICSAVNEIIESFLKNRATDLERGIRELFNQDGGGGMVENFYNHPLINTLFRGTYDRSKSGSITFKDFLKSTNLPSYIPSRNFSAAVIDLVLHPAENVVSRDDSVKGKKLAEEHVNTAIFPATVAALRPGLRALGDTQFGRALRTIAEQSGSDIAAVRANIESWFDSSMERVSGAYKRRTKWIIFSLGLALTVLLNANSITIIKKISTDSTLREVIVAEANVFAKDPEAAAPELEKNRTQLEGLGLPIGWPTGIDWVLPPDTSRNAIIAWTWDNVLFHLLGWLLTAGAISMGAPFWFDLLNKFLAIRASGKPPEKGSEAPPDSRQPPPDVPHVSAPGAAAFSQTNTPPDNRAPGSAAISEQAPTPEPVFTADAAPEDEESDLEGCEIPAEDLTLDEELPPSEGGVE